MHTLPAAQEWIYMLVHHGKPNLTLQMPEPPSLNGFPPPGPVLALQNITQGPKLCLVQCQVGNLHSAQAKGNTQWHLEQLTIARPSSCWVGHHQQVVTVTALTWLQPGHGQTSAGTALPWEPFQQETVATWVTSHHCQHWDKPW